VFRLRRWVVAGLVRIPVGGAREGLNKPSSQRKLGPSACKTLGSSFRWSDEARVVQSFLDSRVGLLFSYEGAPVRILFTIVVASVAVAGFAKATEIEAVLAHPPVDAFFTCSEHWQGQLSALGDDLGKDCVVQRLVEEEGRMWTRPYKSDGRTNEDWFGWGAQLLSPCDCEVTKLHVNPEQNEPGRLGKPPASHIVLRRDDGVHFLLAHIQQPAVAVGDRLSYGDPIARIGNNGYGRSPHLHIGAWKDGAALQVRWDQRKMRIPPEHRKAEAPKSPGEEP
jgi:hypothetical protein